MKFNKVIIVLATGVIFLILGFVLLFNNSDKKEKENDDIETKLSTCESALQNDKNTNVTFEVEDKEIIIPVLDCVEEKEKTDEEVTYASKDNKYQVKVKVWQSDIETASSIVVYNYSIKENYPAHLLLSEDITTENEIKYKLVQAHESDENDNITLKNHVILYTINENSTLSVEFSYTLDEIPAEHFSKIVDNIKIN